MPQIDILPSPYARHAKIRDRDEYWRTMIINWYSTNIDLGNLSQRLRTAYALWISVIEPGELPSLEQIQSSSFYEDLSPYIALTENQGDAKLPKLVRLAAGSKVVELFGADLAAQRLDEVLTEPGQSLAEELFDELRDERKPIHFSVSGSPDISKDVEAIVMPLLHDDAAMELALFVYDF